MNLSRGFGNFFEGIDEKFMAEKGILPSRVAFPAPVTAFCRTAQKNIANYGKIP